MQDGNILKKAINRTKSVLLAVWEGEKGSRATQLIRKKDV